MLTNAQKVRNGIKFLDKKVPKGWKRAVSASIKSETFDINSSVYCVLGEVYGDYWQAKDELELSDKQVEQLGFYALHEVAFDLQAAWVAAYRKGLLRSR